MAVKYLAIVPTLALTVACGGTTTETYIVVTPTIPTPSEVRAVGSAAENGDGSFVVTQGGFVTNLPDSNVIVNGEQAWRIGFNGGTFNADSFAGTDVLAIGGVSADGIPFAGISGTTTAAPTGDATFTGRYAVNETNQNSTSGNLTLAYDLSEGTLTNVGGGLGVDATVSGSDLTGTVTFLAEEAELQGGFFGTNEVAGAFNGASFGGILFGTQ